MARFFQPGQTQYTEQFVPMDLGFIQGQMEGRQAKAEKAMAMAKQPTMDIANINALDRVGVPGADEILVMDQQLKNERLNYYDAKSNEIADLAVHTDPASPETQRAVAELNREYQNDDILKSVDNRYKA